METSTRTIIPVVSRLDDPREIARMNRVVEWLTYCSTRTPPGWSLFCDSKADAVYTVYWPAGAKPAWTDAWLLAGELNLAFCAVAGGHNGICVEHEDGQEIIDPCWPNLRGVMPPDLAPVQPDEPRRSLRLTLEISDPWEAAR